MTDGNHVSPSVFISCRNSDSRAAAAIAKELARYHFDVWAAESGADLLQKLRLSIQSADAFNVSISDLLRLNSWSRRHLVKTRLTLCPPNPNELASAADH
ncbi:TIR domain-containing protein [Streptomyces sp. NBC_01591]|uniref:TIR domain-containing protein n=1 Tax=Streptomyces sp. NBC_01591 TaxID=2975888 RepID=UPI003FA3CAA8